MSAKEKIINSCGFSHEMKEYLKSQNLNDYTLSEIITGSPLTLNKKLKLYELLKSEIAKVLYNETKQALSELDLKEGEVLSFEECWYDHDIFEKKNAFSSLFTSYPAALKYLWEKIADEEWDDVSECWTEICKWVPKKDGTMDLTYVYYLVKDEVVCFKQMKYPPHHQYQGYIDSIDLDLPIPFKPGDVVLLNSLPFTPLRKAVLLEVDNRDCCGVQILYKHYDGLWRTGALKHGAGWHWNYPMLSSLYRLQKTELDDCDEGKLLKRISGFINNNPVNGKKIWDIMNHYEKRNELGMSEKFIKSQLDSRNITSEDLKMIIDELERKE